MERRLTVRGVVADEAGRIFAVKHRNGTTGRESDFWAMPGGGLDVGESAEAGLVREFEEELGITPKLGRLLFTQQFIFTNKNGKQTEKFELYFHVVNTADFKKAIDLSATSHGHELTKAEFIEPSASYLLPDFLQNIKLRSFIDTDQPVLLVDNLNEVPR